MDIKPSNPPASILCTISAITSRPTRYKGQKLRFLGCVDSYDIKTAVVTLGHLREQVRVDVSLLVDDLRLLDGEWVNVIGYLEETDPTLLLKGIMVWGVSAGFNLSKYEDSVAARMEAIL